ncbi:hypothetical protein [Tsukamurella soli]|uniref:Barstar (Barnase inhibitor) n=1 Tax=Tsukamurella soli TaxID=644556 RepID=A0ABP8J5G0_9ACTN
MGVRYEYFAAADDGAAAAVVETGLGLVRGATDVGFVPGAPVLGPDPVSELTGLEAILLGLDDAAALDLISRPDCGRWIAGEPDAMFVVTVARGTVDALLAADHDTLAAAVEPWSRIEEFYGQWPPAMLLAVAEAIRALFAGAEADGVTPYVLISL